MTDAPTAPRYALLNALAFDRLPRAQLDELLAEVQARPPFDGYQMAAPGTILMTNSAKARALRHAHEAWINAAHKAQPVRAPAAIKDNAKSQTPTRTRTHGGANRITAAEANAFLASLPEVPHA